MPKLPPDEDVFEEIEKDPPEAGVAEPVKKAKGEVRPVGISGASWLCPFCGGAVYIDAPTCPCGATLVEGGARL